MKKLTALFTEPRSALNLTLFIFLLLHLYRLAAPPNGYHQWRESDTAAVIQNYYQEDLSFLHPRVNQRGVTSGITGIEFPIYNYTAALLYYLTGPTHIIPRLLTILGGLAALLLFYRIAVLLLLDIRAALYAVWALAFSPLFFFYSYKIMPDIWMLALLLAAVYSFILFIERRNYLLLIGSALSLSLSGCIKPLGLAIYIPFLFLLWANKKRDKLMVILTIIYMIVTTAVIFGWFTYARRVNELYGSGAFYLGEHFLDFKTHFLDFKFLKKLFLQWPFELWIGWILIPAFVIGLYWAIKKKTGRFYIFWILAAYIIFVPTSQHSGTHDYYTLIIVPPLAALTGVGLAKIFEWGRRGWIFAALLLLMAVPGTLIRIHSRFGPTNEFYQIRNDVEKLIPAKSLVMVQDNTTAIRLYQLNRKGWPLRNIIKYDEIKKYVSQGAQFLILDRPIETYDDSLTILFEKNPKTIGSFYCYVLRKSG
ncbi:MAG: glycosyltransferase family 39 protein [candidate division Zixibacteria bacterium]|nr:glycosyltransferase family 39 protein [candidate division Zixibacteria bacterium]